MAGVENDDNATFALLMYAYITAVEEEDEQQQKELEAEPRRVRRAVNRQVWVQPWITEDRRQTLGQFSSLLDTHLRLEDPVAFQNYTRLTPIKLILLNRTVVV